MANNKLNSKQEGMQNNNLSSNKNTSSNIKKDKVRAEKKRGKEICINKDVLRDKDRLEKEYIQRMEEEEKMVMENTAEEKDDVIIDLKEKEDTKQNPLDEKVQQTNTEIKEQDSKGEQKEKQSESAKEEEKKEKRPSRIDLKDKSELFKKIINIAISCEKVEEERKKLKEKNKVLLETNKGLQEDKESLEANLAATELLCKKKQEEIDGLKAEVAHRNEVIDIVKADRTESAQEFKNALAASLKNVYVDFEELKSMDMSDDVGYAVVETIDSVFKILEKNGICIQK